MSTTIQERTDPGTAPAAGNRDVARNPARRGPILLATDGTSKSGAPILAARLIADRLGVPLEIVTVLNPQLVYGMGVEAAPMYMPELDDARRDARETAVKDYVARFADDAPPVPMHVRIGGVASEIAEVARERSATLVVVGSAPHQRLTRIVAGERAAQVLRVADCPVLSVPPGFAALPRSVLAAVDFSPASVRAAQTALLLLSDAGVLTLLHVLSPLMGDVPLRDPSGRDPADAVQTMFGRLRDELRPYVPEDVTVETHVTTNDAIDGVLGTARAIAADLIAVGTHGPGLFERMFLGSVASSILHAAEQPVLAAPPPTPAEAIDLSLDVAGTATSNRPEEWAPALDAFTRRNAGRNVLLEVDDPEIGAQVTGRGYELVGVTYDRHDRRVEIMIGERNQPRHHLMRSIGNVESIALTVQEGGGPEVLEVRHGRGHTLVMATPPVEAVQV